MNLRGHYRSGYSDLGEVQFSHYVEDLQEITKQLGREHVIITTSSGGIITPPSLSLSLSLSVLTTRSWAKEEGVNG